MPDRIAAFVTFPVLETERFVLCAMTSDDANDIFRIMSDPRVTRYFGKLPMASYEEAAQRARAFQTDFQEQTGLRWAITRRDNLCITHKYVVKLWYTPGCRHELTGS